MAHCNIGLEWQDLCGTRTHNLLYFYIWESNNSADIYNILSSKLPYSGIRLSPGLSVTSLSGHWREHLTSTAILSLQKCHTPCGCHWIVTVWHPRPLGWPCPCIYPGPCTEVRTVPSHVSRAELNVSRHHTKLSVVLYYIWESNTALTSIIFSEQQAS